MRNVIPPLTPINPEAGKGANKRVEQPSHQEIRSSEIASEVAHEWLEMEYSLAELAVTWPQRPKYLDRWQTDIQIIRTVSQAVSALLEHPQRTKMSALRYSVRKYSATYTDSVASRLLSELTRVCEQRATSRDAHQLQQFLAEALGRIAAASTSTPRVRRVPK